MLHWLHNSRYISNIHGIGHEWIMYIIIGNTHDVEMLSDSWYLDVFVKIFISVAVQLLWLINDKISKVSNSQRHVKRYKNIVFLSTRTPITEIDNNTLSIHVIYHDVICVSFIILSCIDNIRDYYCRPRLQIIKLSIIVKYNYL